MGEDLKFSGGYNQRPNILVVGLGNLLLQDDGVGIHAVRRFQRLTLHPCPAIEVGTAVFDAVPFFESADRILAFDAIEAKGPPGTVYLLRSGDLIAEEKYDSLHEMGFTKALQTLHRTPVEVVIVGAEPQTIDWGLDLSPPLDAAADVMVSTALKIIAAWKRTDLGQEQIDFDLLFERSQFGILRPELAI